MCMIYRGAMPINKSARDITYWKNVLVGRRVPGTNSDTRAIPSGTCSALYRKFAYEYGRRYDTKIWYSLAACLVTNGFHFFTDREQALAQAKKYGRAYPGDRVVTVECTVPAGSTVMFGRWCDDESVAQGVSNSIIVHDPEETGKADNDALTKLIIDGTHSF